MQRHRLPRGREGHTRRGAHAGGTALVLTGGGARAAYQAGFLQYTAHAFPDAHFDIVTGVSAGAINAAFLAAHPGKFTTATDDLVALWSGLASHDVYSADAGSLVGQILRWGLRLVTGGARAVPTTRGLLDATPLRGLLQRVLHADHTGRIPGIAENIRKGRLRAAAVTTSSYSTGRSVTFVEGLRAVRRDRPNSVTVSAGLNVDHITASSALPLLFPAVRIDDAWYGDGGVRLAAPLSPAIDLGADRILAVTTCRALSADEARSAASDTYPPPAQVAGVLLNAVFLDLVDQDALRLERRNRLIANLPAGEREGLRPIDLVVQRPVRDLGAVANEFEMELPAALRFLTRGWGTRETRSNDALSLLMFEGDYMRRLIELGAYDACLRHDELARFFAGDRWSGEPTRSRETTSHVR